MFADDKKLNVPNVVQNQPRNIINPGQGYTDAVIIDNIENNTHHQKTIGDFIGNRDHLTANRKNAELITDSYFDLNTTITNMLNDNRSKHTPNKKTKKTLTEVDQALKDILFPYINSFQSMAHIQKSGKTGDIKEADDVIIYKKTGKELGRLYQVCEEKLGANHAVTDQLGDVIATFYYCNDGTLSYEKDKDNLIDESNSDEKFENYSGHVIDWKDVSDLPLFAHEPSPADIKQKNIGDCWFLAGLASLAASNPQSIRDSMTEDNRGNVIVRLYKQGYENHNDLSHDEVNRRFNNIIACVNSQSDAITNEIGSDSELSSHIFNIQGALYDLVPHLNQMRDRLNLDFLYEKSKDKLKTLWDAAAQDNFKIEDFLPELVALNKIMCQRHNAYRDNSDYFSLLSFYSGSENNFIPVYYKIKKTIPYIDYSDTNVLGSADSALWVLMLEKALTIHAKECTKNNSESEDPKKIRKLGLNYSNITGANALWTHKNAESGNAATLISGAINNSLALKKDETGITDLFSTADFKDQLSALSFLKNTQHLDDFLDSLVNETKQFVSSGNTLSLKFFEDFIDNLEFLKSEAKSFVDKRNFASSQAEAIYQNLINCYKGQLYNELKNLLESNSFNLNYKPFSKSYTEYALDMYKKIKQFLNDGTPLSAGTITTNENAGGRNGEALRDGIVGGHAYSILGAEEENGIKYVIVRNPWGTHTREYSEDRSESKAVEKNDLGVMKLELNDFMNEFDRLDYNGTHLDCLNDKQYLSNVVAINNEVDSLKNRRFQKRIANMTEEEFENYRNSL